MKSSGDITTKDILPCKVGDIVYELLEEKIVRNKVTGFRIGRLMNDDWGEDSYSDTEWNIDMETMDGTIQTSVRLSEFGKTIFITRSEANLAKESRGNEEKEQEY